MSDPMKGAIVDLDTRSTQLQRIVTATLLLLPVGLLPRLIGMAGSSYTITVAVGTLMLLLLGIRFDRQRTATHARHILVATVLYLPVVLLALLADRRNG